MIIKKPFTKGFVGCFASLFISQKGWKDETARHEAKKKKGEAVNQATSRLQGYYNLSYMWMYNIQLSRLPNAVASFNLPVSPSPPHRFLAVSHSYERY